jgi:hypothetical protein
MYEQSIPALAYVFIGVTSLVITYSQLTGKDVESTNQVFSDESEISDTKDEEPYNAIPDIGESIVESASNIIQDTSIPIAEPVLPTQEQNKMGGRQRKRKYTKQKNKKKRKTPNKKNEK